MRVARHTLRPTTMLNGLLRYLLNVLRERGGALLGLARKGLHAIRSLLGGARGLLRGLLERAISFLAPKGARTSTTAGPRERDALDSMMKRVQEVLRERASLPEEDLVDLQPEPPVAAEPLPASATASPTETITDSSAPEVGAGPAVTVASGSHGAAGSDLVQLAPVLGRAIARAMARRRAARPEPFVGGNTAPAPM